MKCKIFFYFTNVALIVVVYITSIDVLAATILPKASCGGILGDLSTALPRNQILDILVDENTRFPQTNEFIQAALVDNYLKNPVLLKTLYKKNMDPAEIGYMVKKVNRAHKAYGIPIIFEDTKSEIQTGPDQSFQNNEVVRVPVQRLNGLIGSQITGFYQIMSRLIALTLPRDSKFEHYQDMVGYEFRIREFEDEAGEFKFSDDAKDFFTNPIYSKEVENLRSLQRALTNLLKSKEVADLGFIYRESVQYNISRRLNPLIPTPKHEIISSDLLNKKFVGLLKKYLATENSAFSNDQIEKIAGWMRDPDQIRTR
jgi:hypothetical protein